MCFTANLNGSVKIIESNISQALGTKFGTIKISIVHSEFFNQESA